jgi:MscS family membrane protein
LIPAMEVIWSEVQIWEVSFFVLLLLLAWVGSWGLGRLLRGRLESALRSKAPVVGIEVLRTLVPLLRWGLLLVAVAVALHMLKLPPAAEEWLGHGLRAAMAILAAFVAGRAAVTAFAGWSRASADPAEARTRETLAPVLARSCQVFFYLVAVLLVLQNLGYNVAGLLAGLGIGGLAVALAAKETLANLFGSLALLMDRTFQVGDTIRQGDVEGEVVNIGLRSTRVRTKEGYVVSIPNQLITNAPVTNITGS